MKKSEKVKGKENVAAQKQQYKTVGIIAVVVIVVICAAVYIFVSTQSAGAAVGDTVSVTYTGMFDNKTVFDSNVNSTPLTFTIGGGQMIAGFDAAVRGMKVNGERIVTIPDAYTYNPQLVAIVPLSQFPANQTLTPGEKMYERSQDGSARIVTIVNVTSAGVAIDANNPLVGQNLTFDIKLLSITKGSTQSAVAALPTS